MASRFLRDPEVYIDWHLVRRPPLVLCDRCGKMVRCPTKWESPAGWTTEFTTPQRHYCPVCSDPKGPTA